MFIFDAHSDIWLKCNSERRNGNIGYFEDVHISNLKKGKIAGGIFVVYTDTESQSQPDKLFWRELGGICREVQNIENNIDNIIIATKYKDITNAVEKNKFFIILGAEGLSGIGNDIDQIAILYRLGIRHASLTWNEKNVLAAGVGSDNENSGVTDLGEKAIKYMEELGIILDVSHLNEKSFWDVLDISKKPIIASHSNSKTLCGHRRNLTDNQAKAIAATGGVIGVNVCGAFISDSEPTLERYINHIDHFVNTIGIDAVGIGFDFCDFLRKNQADDNDVYFKDITKDLDTISKSGNVIDALYCRGYKESDIRKITHENFLRVLKNTMK